MVLTADHVLLAARDAGFEAAGILPLDAVAEGSLDDWLAAARHGEMRYLEPHAAIRHAPRSAFPKFHSALVVLAEYGDSGPNPADPLLGNVSRYALSDDYHETIKDRLRQVSAAIRSRDPAVRTRALVDANPLNEKVLARIAGLGFIGKHANVIRTGRGSWFFCGVLLISAALDARQPMEKNRCGTCTRCMTACPTGAIVEPYVVDARRCISYLTIELEGPIPVEFREAIGNRIFGCDDCQESCPWNRFANRGPREPFLPRDGLQGRPLAEWLRLTAEAFQRTFADSAVLRIGHRGFIRNVLVAAGNSNKPELREALEPFLAASEPLHRSHAAWALGRLGGATAALEEALRRERDEGVRDEILTALTRGRTPAFRARQNQKFGKT